MLGAPPPPEVWAKARYHTFLYVHDLRMQGKEVDRRKYHSIKRSYQWYFLACRKYGRATACELMGGGDAEKAQD